MGMVCLFGMMGSPFHAASAQTVPEFQLPIARLGVPTHVLLAGTGGTPPYQLVLVNGSLPEGMFLNSEGNIVGTPGSMGDYVFTLRITDSLGAEATQTFHLTVGIVSEALNNPMPAPVPVVVPPAPSVPPAVVTPAPALPVGTSPFVQPPLLGSPVGGAPSLLPFGTGTGISAPSFPSVTPVASSVSMSARFVSAATTATQAELMQQLQQKGIATDSLVSIPSDPSGVNTNVTYYIGRDARRHAFPHPSVMSSWYHKGLPEVRSLTSEELEMIPLGASVTYRPGVNILQFDGPAMYVVTAPNQLRRLADAQAAEAIYGSSWFTRLAGLSDAYFAGYQVTNEAPASSLTKFDPSALESSVATPSDALGL